MSKPPIYRDSTAHRALRHLAENGPTAEVDMRTVMAEGMAAKSADATAGKTLRHLESLGLVKARILLTPAGLEELGRLGWKPELEGVVS